MNEPVNRLESAETKFFKQGGRCALCGKKIVYDNYEKGEQGTWCLHHIDGKSEYNHFSNLACVCINEPQNCHLYVAHGGDYKAGVLAPGKWFRLQGWDLLDLDELLNYTKPSDIIAWHMAKD